MPRDGQYREAPAADVAPTSRRSGDRAHAPRSRLRWEAYIVSTMAARIEGTPRN